MEQLDFIRNAGETRRFHTFPVLRQQNIAEHSWHVVMLLHFLYGQDEPGLRVVLLMAGLCHDAAEHIVGDLPAPAKRDMGERIGITGDLTFREHWGVMEEAILSKVGLDWDKFLDDEERRRLKLCDAADGALYCVRERAMGNKLIATPFYNFSKYLYELLDHESDTISFEDKKETTSHREWELYNYIQRGWANVC